MLPQQPDPLQTKLNFPKSDRGPSESSGNSKAKTDALIADYIVDGILPLTTVRKLSFKRLVNGLSGKAADAPILTYDKLINLLDQR